MAVQPKLLIVGGDGSIGMAIRSLIPTLGIHVVYTTRRRSETADNEVFFELGMSNVGQLLRQGVTHALMLAGVSSIQDCERDPFQSYAINVTASAEVASKLSEWGVPVTMVSTNQVFGRNQCRPQVKDRRNPCCEYGRQKANLEDVILSLGGTVVRCTKVISPKNTIFSAWMKGLQNGEPIRAYANVRIAPLCMKPVARALVEIAVSEPDSNIHHMSPATDGTYWEAAVLIADLLARSRDLVIPTWAHENPSEGVIARKCSALGLANSSELERFGTFSGNIVRFVDEELAAVSEA